jgi:hypothetical protein
MRKYRDTTQFVYDCYVVSITIYCDVITSTIATLGEGYYSYGTENQIFTPLETTGANTS